MPHSLPGCLFIPVLESRPPPNLEEEEEEDPDQQRLISPVRNVIRNHVIAEKALEDLRKSICQIQTNKYQLVIKHIIYKFIFSIIHWGDQIIFQDIYR